MLISISTRPRGGLQQQIYQAVRQAILDGVIAPGTRLPSSRSLAEDLRVSRTTTFLAYEQLTAEGYITARHGSGTYVSRELPENLAPRAPARFAPRVKHPPLSRRGLALAAIPRPARRVKGPPRPFRLGVPALDLFPFRLWSKLVSRRLRAMTLRQLDYGDSAGFPELRKAIAEHVQMSRGTRCTAEQVFVVAGAQRGLQMIASLLLEPSDSVWLEDPGYPGARSALAGAGARIVPVRTDNDGLDVDAGRRQAAGARMAFVTPSHQFPLGAPMSLPRRLALLQWASRADAWVVEDDYDSEFRYDARPIPALHGLDPDGRVIYVGSFSKTMFPAMRLGFVIVPADLRDAFLESRHAADVHPPLLEQMALADFIAHGHYARHLRRMRAAYRERLEAFTEAAERLCAGALRIRPVHTGLHAVADLEGLDEQSVYEGARDRNVEVSPLSVYFFGRPTICGLALGFASNPPEAQRRGMERLAAAVDTARRPRRRDGRTA